MNRQLINRAMAAVLDAAPKAAMDRTRPVYHFRPPSQWMNDVCGAFCHQGQYHVFFQFHPWSDECGRDNSLEGIGWGHARSANLVDWEFLPPALLPSPQANERLAASGSAFVRADGLPMLFFTHTPLGYPANKREARAAVPADQELIAWRRLDLGLAAGRNGVPADIPASWADMFVFRRGGRVFATFKSSGGLICEAVDSSLASWRAIGRLRSSEPGKPGTTEGIAGECPNFFSLLGRQVLVRSTYPISYALGAFDPDTLTFHMQREHRVLDYAYGGDEMPGRFCRGLYGTTVLTDGEDRAILLGWVSGFKPGRGWNGCMCLPRVLSIEDDCLVQAPWPGLAKLRGKHVHTGNLCLANETRRIDGVRGDRLEIVAEMAPGDALEMGLKVRCHEDGRGGLAICYRQGVLDVAGTAVPLFLAGTSETLKMHLFLDKSLLELFVQGGRASVTRVDYPPEDALHLCAFATGGTARLLSLEAWHIRGSSFSIVEKCGSSMGA